MMRCLLLALAYLSVAMVSTPAQGPKTPWTAKAIAFQTGYGGAQVSPDGRLVLWSKSTSDAKEDRVTSHLWVTNLETGDEWKVVHQEEGQSAASWSPDGTRIAWMSSRLAPGSKSKDDAPQIWGLKLGAGGAYPMTKVKGGLSSYAWRNEGELIVQARERKSLRERKEKKEKDRTRVVEEERRFRERLTRLFRLPLTHKGAAKKLERITNNRNPIQGFSVSPNGRYVFWREAQSPSFGADGKDPARTFIRDLKDNQDLELLASVRNRPRSVTWSRDSETLFAKVPRSTVDGENSGAVSDVWAFASRTGQGQRVPLGWDHGVGGGAIQATPDGFIALLENGVRLIPARFTRGRSGWHRSFLEGDFPGNVLSMKLSAKSDRLIFITGSADDPDHWRHGVLQRNRITRIKEWKRPHGGHKNHFIAKSEVITWRGANGDLIEGILHYPNPKRVPANGKVPLITMIHGGPHAADRDRFGQNWAYFPHLYAERGAACLRVNYHGSSSYGLEFGESIKAKYYELEVVDILSGTQMLIDQGLADQERLGLVGWSNGAILAIACLTHRDIYAKEYADLKFKVCVPGAGDVNWTSDYGNCAFGAVFDDFYLGGPPWKFPKVYLEKSPLFHVEKVTTPTLIFFGDRDTAVPTEQGWQWYRALKIEGKAPVRFCLFPGQPHGLNKPSLRKRKLEEEIAWVERYLWDKKPDRGQELADSTPLAHALARQSYARVGRQWGTEINGILAPETVQLKAGDVRIGRFEVTRAQWRAVFPDTPIPTGSENLPMVGITAVDAQNYIKALNKQTGQSFRLLTKKEWDALPSGASENRLDYWASAAPSPSEARWLRGLATQVAARPGAPPLLEPAGNRPCALARFQDRPVRLHDTKGNAAEWVLSGDNKPILMGPCAITATDPRAPRAKALPAYAGLRVALNQ